MLRVRFAPSPTGYLHIGSARTFIFNWLYARHNGGTMILRIDDTDIERNTEESLRSIFDGLTWLGLDWDEQYRQSERLALHKTLAERNPRPRSRLSRFHAARSGRNGKSSHRRRLALQSRPARNLARRERPSRRPRRKVRPPLSRPARHRRSRHLPRPRLRRAIEDGGRYRGLRPAPQQRRAHLSSRLLRRRCRSPHQPHRSRAGPSHQHVQARPDLSRRRPRAAAVRASSAARSRPTAASSPSAVTARSFPSPPGATAAFCPRLTSIFSACSAGRPRTIASR